MMPRPNIPHLSALAFIFMCFLRPLSAALVNQCSASEVSCTKTIMNALEMEEADRMDNSISLLQSRSNEIKEDSAEEQHKIVEIRATPLESEVVGQEKVPAAFDCETYPKLCKAPFECHKVENLSQGPAWLTGTAPTGLAPNGPNMQSWCFEPQFESYLHECLVNKDLVKAGHIQYELTKSGNYGPDVYELEGSTCFIEGHCSNTRVTSSTTMEEAIQMCDERFGRSRWANFGSLSSQDVIGRPPLQNTSNGFNGQENTTPFLVASCAMGNYHCDVMYCKETYCKDEYLVKKYGHFLKDLGWTASTASWMNARQSLRGRQTNLKQ